MRVALLISAFFAALLLTIYLGGHMEPKLPKSADRPFDSKEWKEDAGWTRWQMRKDAKRTIRKGMSVDEVEELLGGYVTSTSNDVSYPCFPWVLSHDLGNRPLTWSVGPALEVYFDEDMRVVHVEISEGSSG